MKIGFFDSGLGGLLILQATSRSLPDYDYLYYGDTANLPYGDKTEDEIYEFTKKGVITLFEEGCALVIIACNTASAETMRKLQDNFLPDEYPGRRILGVIIPTVEELINSKASRAMIIATRRTIESGKYPLELGKRNAGHITMYGVATPELVPLIESGDVDTALEKAVSIINAEIDRVGEIDTVILGCTHYVKLKERLKENFPKIRFLSQDEIIPEKIKDYLNRHPEIESKLDRGGMRHIKLTEDREDYVNIASELLGGVFMSE